MKEIRFTDIEGIKVGHEQNLDAATGCTVIISEDGAVAGVDVRGGAPGTRETDLLNPINLVEKVHAVLLAGGSAFGLDAASGIMEYLEEHNIGFDVGMTKVPIVTGAVLFDLAVGDYRIRPDKAMGYRACRNASVNECLQGNVGAGTGATVGKLKGQDYATKGGLGCFALQVGDLKVGAVIAVNCFGDVIDPRTGEILAGMLTEDRKKFAETERIMAQQYRTSENIFSGNTTIGVVATNARLNKSQATKIASIAHNGFARTIRPAHTMADGDTIFTLGTEKTEADINVIGLLAVKAVEEAVIRAVKNAESLYGYPCYLEIYKKR